MPTLPRRQLISQRQESRVARETGGSSANRGAANARRADVTNEHMLGECKVTEGKSFSLRVNHRDGWAAIERKAQAKAKEPYMVIQVEGKELAVVDFQWFNAARQHYERNGGRFV